MGAITLARIAGLSHFGGFAVKRLSHCLLAGGCGYSGREHPECKRLVKRCLRLGSGGVVCPEWQFQVRPALLLGIVSCWGGSWTIVP